MKKVLYYRALILQIYLFLSKNEVIVALLLIAVRCACFGLQVAGHSTVVYIHALVIIKKPCYFAPHTHGHVQEKNMSEASEAMAHNKQWGTKVVDLGLMNNLPQTPS